jgi:hypothetical protein
MSFLSRLLGRPAGHDSSIDSVTYDDVGVSRHHASGRVDDVDWADLREIVVMVRADGRGQPDPHVVLTGQKASTIVNSRVQGVDVLVTRLGKLTGFDQEAFDRATAATERARVVCWRRGGKAAAEPAADAPAPAPAARPVPVPASVSTPAAALVEGLELELVPMHGEPAAPASPAVAPQRPAVGGAPRLDIAPTRSTVAACAHDTVRNMARVYKVRMDGSIESLVHIDRAIAEWHAGGASLGAVDKSLYSMGAYAGEALLRHARGRWIDAPGQGPRDGKPDDAFLVVELEDGRRWAPITLCVNALSGGPEHSLLRSARALLQGPASGRL